MVCAPDGIVLVVLRRNPDPGVSYPLPVVSPPAVTDVESPYTGSSPANPVVEVWSGTPFDSCSTVEVVRPYLGRSCAPGTCSWRPAGVVQCSSSWAVMSTSK